MPWCRRPQNCSRSFFTCLSADNDVFPFQRTEKSFRQCRHRKVATRQTLPRIHTSLSLKKLSMVQKNKTTVRPSSLFICISCFQFQLLHLLAFCAGLRAVDIWQDIGPLIQNTDVLEPPNLHNDSYFQAPDRLRSVEALRSSHLPAQPPIDPSNRLPSLPLSTPLLSTATLDQKGEEDMPSVR